MNHDRRSLETWARESAFRIEGVEKVVRLGELLTEVTRQPFLDHRRPASAAAAAATPLRLAHRHQLARVRPAATGVAVRL